MALHKDYVNVLWIANIYASNCKGGGNSWNKELLKLSFPGVVGMWKRGNTNYSFRYLPLRLIRFTREIREESSGRWYGDTNLRNRP